MDSSVLKIEKHSVSPYEMFTLQIALLLSSLIYVASLAKSQCSRYSNTNEMEAH